MKKNISRHWRSLLSVLIVFLVSPLTAQHLPEQVHFYSPDPGQRAFDSLVVSRIPLIMVPADALTRSLPDSLDNSSYQWFPGILNQHSFFSCQQYSGTAYTFAYEMNRLRNVNGKLTENKYPPHYMWHFFNDGEQYIGVNFLHSFHAMMEQGHMTNADYGSDTGQLEKGWINGYDKYYRSMRNRIRNVYAIPVNSAQGIQTVKQYLYDHLDGSSTGGVACFTASSPSGYGSFLPGNTPEAGKYVMTDWNPYPTHGMTIVGYHDSIRYDLNSDGQYTNDIDINGDGDVDARDWEIGGFRLANSYGNWWADLGYFYVLYHAMASNFEQGGVWNNCVFVVEPDPDYTPLLTMKVDLEHTHRNQLNVMAGVSLDMQADFPDNLFNPLIFSNQGGPYYMQGFDSLPEQKRLEFGLDVTPLLSFLEPGVPAKFFLVIEDRDPSNTGQGIVHAASFIHYGATTGEFPCSTTEVSLNPNGTTILSATGTATFQPPVILNAELPAFSASGNFSVQFQAQDGEPPYSWGLHQPYQKMDGGAVYFPFDGQQLQLQSSGKPYAAVALPFAFPFFGSSYDTVYVNAYGMVQFSSEHLPYPYLCSAVDMFDYISAIAPSFSWNYTIRQSEGDGIWMTESADSVKFRWQLSVHGDESQTRVEFGVTLFPDGKVTFSYGPVQLGQNNLVTWFGISPGDKLNTLVYPIFDPAAESGTACTWVPPAIPGTALLSREGLLAVTGADTGTIYDLHIRVTDKQGISTDKSFQLSSGLIIRHELVSGSGYLQEAEPAALDLEVSNIGPNQLADVVLQFLCENPELIISGNTTSAGTLEAGQVVDLADAFTFVLQSDLPDQTALPCRVVATSGGRSWEHSFALHVSAPNLKVTGMELQDGVNSLLDAGETAHLAFTLSNLGSLPAENISVTLSTGDEFLEILSSQTLQTGTMGQKGMYTAVYTLHSSRNTPPGHLANLELAITNGSTIEIIYPCTLSLGTRPVALINMTSSTTTSPLMASLMDSLQLGYDQFTGLPENLNTYPALFLILGTGYPGSYALSTEETNQLIGYLVNGGHVYMESYASWYYGTAGMLEEIFKFSTERVSVYYFNEMEGVEGTFTEGMDYDYIGSSSPYAIFEVIPDPEGISLMRSKGTPARCLEFAYDGEDYKTIGTFKEFGLLVDGETPSHKAILFKHYLDFLEVNIDGPFPFFHADTINICQWHTIQFTDDSFDDVTSWQWEFPGGIPASSTEQNPSVQFPAPGAYDVILTISDGIHTQTMHKKRYIHVHVCAGIEDMPAATGSISIYPNPANDVAYLVLPKELKGGLTVELIDLCGSVVMYTTYIANPESTEFPLQISALSSGMYIVRVIGSNTVYSTKLVIW